MRRIVTLTAIIICFAMLTTSCANSMSKNTEANADNLSTTTTLAPTPTPIPTPTPVPTPTPTPEPMPTPAPEVDRSAAYIYEANEDLTPVNYDSPVILPPSEDMGEDYIGRLTFICDSPTYWLGPKGFLKNGKDTTQIWTGPEGTMTLAYQSTYHILDPFDNKQKPIRDVVEQHKPDILIIALGINGISFMDEAYFVSEYTNLVTDIQEISPDTIMILQSIYPITHRYRYYGNITNATITRANSWILKIAEENDCAYLDTISVLLTDEGNAKDELMLKDGLHPNEDGLQVIIDYIRTHGYIEE